MNCASAIRLPLAAVILALAACSSAPEIPDSAPDAAVDFSGAWEVDYSQSDNIRDRYEMMVRELQRQAERRARGVGQSNSTVSVGGGLGGEDLYTLARMAEMITDVQLLDIEQDEIEISVKREGSFALQCEFHAGSLHKRDTSLGSELCGWDGGCQKQQGDYGNW